MHWKKVVPVIKKRRKRSKRARNVMESLVGRDVEIPRSVFAKDIAREASEEPPNGKFWKGKIVEQEDCGRLPFKLMLEVLLDGEPDLEEQWASLAQIRKWIAESSLQSHETRATLGAFRVPAKTPKTVGKTRAPLRTKDVFASPVEYQR